MGDYGGRMAKWATQTVGQLPPSGRAQQTSCRLSILIEKPSWVICLTLLETLSYDLAWVCATKHVFMDMMWDLSYESCSWQHYRPLQPPQYQVTFMIPIKRHDAWRRPAKGLRKTICLLVCLYLLPLHSKNMVVMDGCGRISKIVPREEGRRW